MFKIYNSLFNLKSNLTFNLLFNLKFNYLKIFCNSIIIFSLQKLFVMQIKYGSNLI